MGMGPAAHSYFGGTRFSIKPDVELYNRALEKRSKMLPGSILDENIKIGKKEQERTCLSIIPRQFISVKRQF